MNVTLHRFDVESPERSPLACAALLPEQPPGLLPICVFLYGGGGSRESLVDLRPLLESCWASGALPPMLMVTPDVGAFSFYLDAPERAWFWEQLVGDRLLPALRARFGLAAARSPAALLGISMGGYGALKIALSRPERFRGVAAISPMLEPAFEAGAVPLRNRYFYPPEVPQQLLGPERDPELHHRDHPATRARHNAAALRASELAIYLDAAGSDALNAHDGAEHLHRVLWQLDVAHDYHLRRDSDHMGPDMAVRLQAALAWLGERLSPPLALPLTASEAAWRDWLSDPSTAPPGEPLAPSSRLFPAVLRAQLAPLHRAASERDPSLERRYGELPPARDT